MNWALCSPLKRLGQIYHAETNKKEAISLPDHKDAKIISPAGLVGQLVGQLRILRMK